MGGGGVRDRPKKYSVSCADRSGEFGPFSGFHLVLVILVLDISVGHFQAFTLEPPQNLGIRSNQGQKWIPHSQNRGCTGDTTRHASVGWPLVSIGGGGGGGHPTPLHPNRRPTTLIDTQPTAGVKRPHCSFASWHLDTRPAANRPCPHGFPLFPGC